MESNRFEEMWNSRRERIFPDWNSDIRELINEAAKDGNLRVEVILDRMDEKEFLSIFDYEGGNIAEDLGGSGTVAVMSARSLIKRYRSQMRESQPLFRFYRTAASVATVIGLKHPNISSARDQEFDRVNEDCIADPVRNMILFRKDTLESVDTYYRLFVMIRRLWQMNMISRGEGDAVVPDSGTDAAAFGALMMDVLFQIEYPPEKLADDEISREKIRRRTVELAEELYG